MIDVMTDSELPGMWETADLIGGSTDTAADDTRREDEPGDWTIAGFIGECSRGGGIFAANDTIRADGDGGWECRKCVNEDEADSPWNLHGEDPYAVGGAA